MKRTHTRAVPLLAWAAAASLVAYGVAAVEARTAARQTRSVDESEAPEAERTFRPGIPGMRMVDVRDHKFLWREIDQLQSWERGGRISVDEYRSKVIEKTAHFLELDDASGEFAAAASGAVAVVRESFLHGRRSAAEDDAVGKRFSTDLEAAVTRVASLLRDEPRHRLFVPECKKWLLKLAFGPRESKEARGRVQEVRR